MLTADRDLRGPISLPDRLGSRPTLLATALHIMVVLLLLGAAAAIAPTPPPPDVPTEVQITWTPQEESQHIPLITEGEGQVPTASLRAPEADTPASGGAAPEPRLAASLEGKSPEPADPSPPRPSEAQPAEAPLPRPKPAPPVLTAAAPSEAPPVPSSKPNPPQSGGGADILNPFETGGGLRGSPNLSGDRYLSLVRAEIERRRAYASLPHDLLGGTAIFGVIIDRDGRILALRLRKSTGTRILDDTGAEMIRRASLPPPPPEIPGEAIELEVALQLWPS
jgi:protein TonB